MCRRRAAALSGAVVALRASDAPYYYNEATKTTTWEHPLDHHFKSKVAAARRKHQDQTRLLGMAPRHGSSASGSSAASLGAAEVIIDSAQAAQMVELESQLDEAKRRVAQLQAAARS